MALFYFERPHLKNKEESFGGAGQHRHRIEALALGCTSASTVNHALGFISNLQNYSCISSQIQSAFITEIKTFRKKIFQMIQSGPTDRKGEEFHLSSRKSLKATGGPKLQSEGEEKEEGQRDERNG